MSIACAESRDHVILECLYRSLGRVDAMVVWLNKLNVDVAVVEISLDGFGGDIVDNIEYWFESALGEVLNVVLKGGDCCHVLSILHWCCEDGIGGPIVEDENGGHAVHGPDGEFSSEINVDRAIFVVDAARIAEKLVTGFFCLGWIHVTCCFNLVKSCL